MKYVSRGGRFSLLILALIVSAGCSIELQGPVSSSSSGDGTAVINDPVNQPPTEAWASTDLNSAPIARSEFASIWTGSKFIIWGGCTTNNCATLHQDGAAYDPVQNTWSAISQIGAPSARRDAKAVWTGQKMLVWGGIGASSTMLGDGAAYDPANDSWSPITSINAPAGRYAHSLIWTGSQMIVFGGRSNSPTCNDLSSGAMYNPSSDVWTTMSAVGVGAISAPAIWTGSQMLIWGGDDCGQIRVNTGYLYNPATNIWSSTTTIGAPSARRGHTLIWTGSKAIVWGGDYNTLYNTGGIYDPIANAWTATSLTDAPTAREGHSAVWTGSRMIIWGGTETYLSDNVVTTGGIFNPDSNQWKSTTTISAPLARMHSSAAWLGNKMLIWAGTGHCTFGDGNGCDWNGRTPSGALYTP